MGEKAKEVKLYGYWASSDCAMVRHALGLKGVTYEYVESDLDNPIRAVLQLNPVHKTVPVLVVDGRVIVGPPVIFEFIEEVWKDPPLFPKDPYSRSRVRFCVQFFYQKVMLASYAILKTEGETHWKATKEFIEHMTTMEGGIVGDFASKGPFINGVSPNLLDMMIGSCSNGLRALGAVPGVELLDKKRMPVLYSAMTSFVGLEAATEIPYDELMERHWVMRERFLAMEMAPPGA